MSELFVERGGEGERLVVLLHGLGATAAVWHPLIEMIEREWKGRWLAPDFRGHGRSIKSGPYDFKQHAADVAALIANERGENVVVLGHSFGGVIAALVASGDFGVQQAAALAFGVKIKWAEAEIAKAHELATKPAKIFASREEAIDRYLKMAGLFGLIEPTSPDVEAGISAIDGGWRVAQEPATFSAVGPSVSDALKKAKPAIRLAAGSKDPMVSLDDMRPIDSGARLFEGAGHNVHVEAPQHVWAFLRD